MQVLDAYPLPPGCCALCKSTATPLIDTQLNTDDLPVEFAAVQSGWVYVCVQCVFHMAALLGGASPEMWARLRSRLHEVETQYAACRDQLRAANQAITAMQRAGYSPAKEESRV